MEKGLMLVVSGPAGSGKGTVNGRLSKMEGYAFSVSATTRAPRPGEVDGVNYHFISREEFEELIRTEGVLEWTEYAGAYYGTPRSEITRIHAAGRIPLLILDVVGVHSLVSKSDLSVCGIYVWDKLSVMEERIFQRYLGEGENTDGRRRFEGRKKQNRDDYLSLPDIIGDFYGTVKNEGTPAETATKVAEVFAAFQRRDPRPTEQNLALAKELRCSAN